MAAKYLLNPRETYQCIGCGQCSANCPEKAIIGKPHYKIVKELIKDPDKIVVFSTSPSEELDLQTDLEKNREPLHRMKWLVH